MPPERFEIPSHSAADNTTSVWSSIVEQQNRPAPGKIEEVVCTGTFKGAVPADAYAQFPLMIGPNGAPVVFDRRDCSHDGIQKLKAHGFVPDQA